MAIESPDSAYPEPDSPSRREIEQRIARLTARQKQLISPRQLAACGLSPRTVRGRIDRGRLHRIHPSVLCVHPPPFSAHQIYLAAVGACGPGTAISDSAAAWLLGARERRPELPHTTNSSGRGRRIDGIVVHQRSLDPGDVMRRFGIPCTSPARTALDCAETATIRELEELLMALDTGHPRLERRRLDELVAGNPGRRGIRNLRELITDDPKETESLNERRMLRICRREGIPDPETQYPIIAGGRRFRADFCWPSLRLVIEADSWRWHGGKLKTEDDRDRDQLLAIAGWLVVHFTRNQIKLDPDETGRRLVALVGRRR